MSEVINASMIREALETIYCARLEKKAVLEEARAKILALAALRREAEEVESFGEARPTIMREVASFGSGAVGDKVSSAAVKLAKLHEDINNEMSGLAEHIDLAHRIIAAVGEEIDRVILREHYLNGLTWDEVADRVGYTERWCRERRNNALRINSSL